MENNIGSLGIFLGAGASRPFEILTMKEMVEEFPKWLAKRNEDEDVRDNYNKLMQGLFDTLEEGYDIETLFSLINGLKALNEGKKQLGITERFIANTQFNLTTKDWATISISNKSLVEIESKLKQFIRESVRIREETVTRIRDVWSDLLMKISGAEKIEALYNLRQWFFVTTNYDLIIERYFRNFLGRDIETGFTKSNIPNREFPYQERGFDGLTNDNGTSLLKLHGSINWLRKSGGTSNFGKFVETDWDIEGSPAMFPRSDYEGELVLYPLQEKLSDEVHFTGLFHSFQNRLSRIENWLIIGYSFNDQLIFNAFSDEEVKRKIRRIVVVCPDPENKRNVMEFQKVHSGVTKLVDEHFGEKSRFAEINDKITSALKGP